MEQLELDQKEKQGEKDVEKKKQVMTTRILQKFRVEWKQWYPWLDFKDGKMIVLFVVL